MATILASKQQRYQTSPDIVMGIYNPIIRECLILCWSVTILSIFSIMATLSEGSRVVWSVRSGGPDGAETREARITGHQDGGLLSKGSGIMTADLAGLAR